MEDRALIPLVTDRPQESVDTVGECGNSQGESTPCKAFGRRLLVAERFVRRARELTGRKRVLGLRDTILAHDRTPSCDPTIREPTLPLNPQTFMRNSLLLPVLVLSTAVTAAGQSVIVTANGLVSGQQFGNSVAPVPDLDGDGIGDLLVGTAALSPNGATATVVSGATGALIYPFSSQFTGDLFGISVADVGHFDAGTSRDYIIGAPSHSNAAGQQVGAAYIVTSFSATPTIRLIEGTVPGGRLGSKVLGLPDLDGDGLNDVAVAVPSLGTGGEVQIHYSDPALTPMTIGGVAVGLNRFGEDMAMVGDVDGDGSPDLLIGSYDTEAQIRSLATGALIHSFSEPGHDEFGSRVAAIGDLDGDGFRDVMIADPNADSASGIHEAGRLHVYSGNTGVRLYGLEGVQNDEAFAAGLAAVADQNSDGIDDLLVGSPGFDVSSGAGMLSNAGRFALHSGADGTRLASVDGTLSHAWFGFTVSSAADVNADGVPDFTVAETRGPGMAGGLPIPSAGNVATYASAVDIGVGFCGQQPANSTGQMGKVQASGDLKVASNFVTVRAYDLPANENGFFLASLTGVSPVPPVLSPTLCLGGSIARFNNPVLNSGANGSFDQPVDVTSIPTNPSSSVMVGQTWFFQAYYRDGNSSNFTTGVSVTFL